ncbi:hypothetical protein Xvie_01053 [Xenorhabdus vietnamensis]|uniref:Alpha-glutamyl/putrescinyl thymine pyrophosphorylase clade 3 domain-containing protein n=1 Tax=Xenorhabdus vietnamensis TaxID=351656 RepID=A0A1Y2SIE0_9GAMM|nr:hypothetical protein [Xenorhabdus vietnamensis]OTA17659.1 hypothetical protein Xvie_01053 [Xenorhabdus vietnamensis]
MAYKNHKDINLYINAIRKFEKKERKLLGLKNKENYETLSRQLIDSVRRIEYIKVIGDRDISRLRKNPHSDIFDPLRAAWLYIKEENYNEAYWLIFLSTCFGIHKKYGWNLCADIYGGLGTVVWTWDIITQNFEDFKKWYRLASIEMLRDNIKRGFGNHRKYESLRYNSNRAIPIVIESYIKWIGVSRDHEVRFLEASIQNNYPNKYILFDIIYKSMKSVISFGRTARFDYLTMLAKFNLLNIEPLTLYLNGATGPKDGANLLFYGYKKTGYDVARLNNDINELANELPITKLASQVLEDALCNWQKSPSEYIYFGG